VTIIHSPRNFENVWNQKFGKTPAWTIAHCLEQRKCYCLFPCDISELGKASDNAYLIVGELNKKRIHIEVKENNKSIAHGPIINYVLSNDNKFKGKQKTETLVSVLYIPSTR